MEKRHTQYPVDDPRRIAAFFAEVEEEKAKGRSEMTARLVVIARAHREIAR